MSKQTVRIHVDTCTAVDWYPASWPPMTSGDSAFEVECGKPAEYLEIVRYHSESAWDEINEGHGTPETVSASIRSAPSTPPRTTRRRWGCRTRTSRSTPGGSRTCDPDHT